MATDSIVTSKPKKLPFVLPLPAEPQAQSTWALGSSFETAALQILHAETPAMFIPALYLLMHSLELYLKAFLFSQNITEKELRGISHDLVACIKCCRERGLAKHLVLPRAAVVQVVRVNRYYSDKELEYFSSRAKRFGDITALAATVKNVGRGVFDPISEGTFRAWSQ